MASSNPVTRVHWTDEEVSLLIPTLLEQKTVGNWAGTGPNSTGLKHTASALHTRFGISKMPKQIKNKYEALKAEYTCWNKLKAETGLGWDVSTGTIQASDEWWNRKTNEDPLAKKFRNRAPLLEDLQAELFGNSIATGSSHWTPASNQFLSDQRRNQFRDERPDLNNEYSPEVDCPNWVNVGEPVREEDSVSPPRSVPRRGVQSSSRLSGEKRKQMEGSSSSHFDNIRELLSSPRSINVNYNTQEDTEWDTIFQKLGEIFTEDEVESSLYLGIVEALQNDRTKRKVFVRLPKRSLKAWIQKTVNL